MFLSVFTLHFFSDVMDEYETMGAPRYNKTDADYDVRRKRAQILGYLENEHGEPVAKKLKFDDTVGMEIDNEAVEIVDGKPPLPLIDITARPPLPAPDKEEASSEDVGESEIEGGAEKVEDEKLKNSEEEDVFKKEDEQQEDSSESIDNNKDSTSSSDTRLNSSTAKEIDETTYRHWYTQPFSSIGLTYTMYTPPPQCLHFVDFANLPKDPVTEIDREPWKTSNVSWYFPLYGDLAAPTGTFDNIRTLLKDTKRPKRKPMGK